VQLRWRWGRPLRLSSLLVVGEGRQMLGETEVLHLKEVAVEGLHQTAEGEEEVLSQLVEEEQLHQLPILFLCPWPSHLALCHWLGLLGLEELQELRYLLVVEDQLCPWLREHQFLSLGVLQFLSLEERL
jgi:hypothetical protein